MDYQTVYRILVNEEIVDEVESKEWCNKVVKELEAQGKSPEYGKRIFLCSKFSTRMYRTMGQRDLSCVALCHRKDMFSATLERMPS